jgi:hypothetical protein
VTRVFGSINVSIVHDGKSWKLDYIGGESHVRLHENTARMTHHILTLLVEHLLAVQAGKTCPQEEVAAKKEWERLERLEKKHEASS